MDFLKSILPTLATAVGGPLGAGAAAFFADRLNLSEKSVDAVVKAVSGASPEQLFELKKIDAELKKMYLDAGIKLEEIAAADRASARNLQIATGDKTPRNLAYIYGIAFFAVIAAQIVMGVQGVIMPSGVEKTLDMLLGVLTGMVLGSKEYFFGTSAGSAQKTELLASTQKDKQ